MAYNVEKAIDRIGKERVLKEIYDEGLTQIDLHKFLNLSTSDTRLNNAVYKRMYTYLGITELPYPKLSRDNKIFKILCDKSFPNYWENERLVFLILRRLGNPTINIADNRIRSVITLAEHPRANAKSGQIKAHEVAWELYNRQYLPPNHWVVPIDNNYLNLEEDNLRIVNTTEFKSDRFSGEGNPAYIDGSAGRPKLGGWSYISRTKREADGKCAKCLCTDNLVVHHIINYNLFTKPIEAHQPLNLITLCRECHGKVHGHSISIKQDLIAEMRYSKLIELLETLKSQVPDTLMETYKDVEKQLGLTDNQQPSI